MPPHDEKKKPDPKAVEKRKRKKKKKKHNKQNIMEKEDDKNDTATSEPRIKKKPVDHSKMTSTKNNKNDNPLLESQQKFLANHCTRQECDHFFSNALLDPERRAQLWMDQAEAGEALVDQYAWAIPDERALRILKHFSPLVEIGCGANAYWARLLAQAGVDIVAYDQFPDKGGQIHSNKKKKRRRSSPSFQVQKGGPGVLASKKIRNSDRTLFLCYCDEEAFQQKPPSSEEDDDSSDEEKPPPTSLGSECLRHYQGDYIIHVGELYGDTLSLDQAPWGRSSGAQFQQELAATYHCLLRVGLPNWIHVRDTISVWKRSETCSIVFAADSDDEEGDDEEVEYRHIPVSERLPTDVAAPCLTHLLEDPNTEHEDEDDKFNFSTKQAHEELRMAMTALHQPKVAKKKPEDPHKQQPVTAPPPSPANSDYDSIDSSKDSSDESKRKASNKKSSLESLKKQRVTAQSTEANNSDHDESSSEDSDSLSDSEPKQQKATMINKSPPPPKGKRQKAPTRSDNDSDDSSDSSGSLKKKARHQKGKKKSPANKRKKQETEPPSSEEVSEDEVIPMNEEPDHYAPAW